MSRTVAPNILDTHAWLWLMEGDTRIPSELVSELEEAATRGQLFVTTLSLWEIAALEAAARIRFLVPVPTWISDALSTPGLNLMEMDPDIAVESTRLPGTFGGDPVDRLLVAAARTKGGRIITADPAIIAYGEAGYVDVIRAVAG